MDINWKGHQCTLCSAHAYDPHEYESQIIGQGIYTVHRINIICSVNRKVFVYIYRRDNLKKNKQTSKTKGSIIETHNKTQWFHSLDPSTKTKYQKQSRKEHPVWVSTHKFSNQSTDQQTKYNNQPWLPTPKKGATYIADTAKLLLTIFTSHTAKTINFTLQDAKLKSHLPNQSQSQKYRSGYQKQRNKNKTLERSIRTSQEYVPSRK